MQPNREWQGGQSSAGADCEPPAHEPVGSLLSPPSPPQVCGGEGEEESRGSGAQGAYSVRGDSLPGPLLHKFVEGRGKKSVAVRGRKARSRSGDFPARRLALAEEPTSHCRPAAGRGLPALPPRPEELRRRRLSFSNGREGSSLLLVAFDFGAGGQPVNMDDIAIVDGVAGRGFIGGAPARCWWRRRHCRGPGG